MTSRTLKLKLKLRLKFKKWSLGFGSSEQLVDFKQSTEKKLEYLRSAYGQIG
jgi:hypothetical protein